MPCPQNGDGGDAAPTCLGPRVLGAVMLGSSEIPDSKIRPQSSGLGPDPPLQAALAIGASLVLFIALPNAFKGTFDLDTRFIVMAAFVGPAALVPIAPPRRAVTVIGIGFLLLFSARMTVLMTVWHGWASYLAAFRAVIAQVQPGDVVLTARLPRGPENDIWTSIATARRLSDGTVVDSHLPALLLIEHRAWWPFLFDNPSQQPIETRPPFRALSRRIDLSPDPIGLLARDAPGMWPITHVLVRGPAPGPGEIETRDLKLVAKKGEAALYAVMRDEISPPPPPSPPTGR